MVAGRCPRHARYEVANSDVGGPLPHDGASSVEEVAALVGAFDDVSKRGFGDLAGGRLCRKLALNPCGVAGMSRSMSSLRTVLLESCWPVALGKMRVEILAHYLY